MVQAVLIYGSEIWVITDAMMKVLEGFHHHIDRKITGNTERRFGAEGWEGTPMEKEVEASGLWPMQDYSMQD